MANSTYEYFKETINAFIIPATVFKIRKNPDGTCSEASFFVVNEIFKKSYIETFKGGENAENFDSDAVSKMVEGTMYYDHMPKDVKFENILIEAAFDKKHIETYVDTTKMYGYWTQDILFPIECPVDFKDTDPNAAFCLFMYTLNKEMDAGKYASVSPDISSFVIKACLELQGEKEFLDSISTVISDIREYSKAYSAAIMTYVKDQRSFNIIAESTQNNTTNEKNIFSTIPFEVVASWEGLLKDTNCIIIKDESDMELYAQKAPEWVETLKQNNVHNLCLVPFVHQKIIIGYLYIRDFDASELTRIKETIELVSFFLTAEIANHLFLERLEYLSNVDMLTGVFNRNCMNINVDELALKMEFNPRPFNVAFLDLNGLKTINDNGGHDQGDKLLVYAADLLKQVFKGDKIYRAGGDEFVVISFDSEKDFDQKITELKEKACDPEWLYFAIGTYHDEYDGQLRLAMRYADEAMYRDKDAFYEKYPDKRR